MSLSIMVFSMKTYPDGSGSGLVENRSEHEFWDIVVQEEQTVRALCLKYPTANVEYVP